MKTLAHLAVKELKYFAARDSNAILLIERAHDLTSKDKQSNPGWNEFVSGRRPRRTPYAFGLMFRTRRAAEYSRSMSSGKPGGISGSVE